ncbi:hypothetical protein [Rossellomorea sp. DUT-2]|uniref:hypothetical protein n=1 Tax=Rossellomorea sp. DUT-2 TaxID=3412021 RepID=UPI003D1744FF
MKIVLIIVDLFMLLSLIHSVGEKLTKSGNQEVGEVIQKLSSFVFSLGCFGLIIFFMIAMFGGFLSSLNDDQGNYDNTPSEWGPGADHNSNPGTHQVDGYYKSNGTYVEPYLRSNPDGNPHNNLNQ